METQKNTQKIFRMNNKWQINILYFILKRTERKTHIRSIFSQNSKTPKQEKRPDKALLFTSPFFLIAMEICNRIKKKDELNSAIYTCRIVEKYYNTEITKYSFLLGFLCMYIFFFKTCRRCIVKPCISLLI